MVPSNREKGTFWTDLCSKYNCPTELTQQKNPSLHLTGQNLAICLAPQSMAKNNRTMESPGEFKTIPVSLQELEIANQTNLASLKKIKWVITAPWSTTSLPRYELGLHLSYPFVFHIEDTRTLNERESFE